ncbi:MAG TPA: recombinase family protein [Gemmataceae bacterium]
MLSVPTQERNHSPTSPTQAQGDRLCLVPSGALRWLSQGWTCLPERYDDGGFTGGNMERPALQRLLADIQAGKIDSVVTYKVDRLSRSLLDFAKMMETFEQHGVSFVSITQQFNWASVRVVCASGTAYAV